MKGQILHLTHDDKFIDFLIDEFDALSSVENRYLVYTKEKTDFLTHVKSPKVKFAQHYSKEFNELLGDINNYDAIFIHYLSPFLSELVLEAQPQTPIYIVFWGSEFFTLPELKDFDLAPITRDLMNKINGRKFNFAFKPKNLKLEINRYLVAKSHARLKKKALRRANYICHWIDRDIDYLRESIGFNAIKKDFIYGTLEKVTWNYYNHPFTSDGNNILIGNSANETNNHLDLFEQLKNIEITANKIYVPLSYSSPSKKYIEEVIRIGYLYFGDKFTPITEFIPREEYYDILLSCDFVFMNHIRSQAGAVNRFVIYSGKKLFMNNDSNMYDFYRSKGLHITSVQDGVTNASTIWNPLSLKQKEQNRLIMEETFGNESVRNKYRSIIKDIL